MSSQKFTIAEAHRATGKSESTIRLHLKDRKNPLSSEKDSTGKVLIDGAELMRRYPDDVTLESLEAAKLKRNGAGKGSEGPPVPEKSLETQLLKKDLEHTLSQKSKLEEEVEFLKNLYEDEKSNKDRINQWIGLIEDQTKERANHNTRQEDEIKRLTQENAKLKTVLKEQREKEKAEQDKGFFEKLLKG